MPRVNKMKRASPPVYTIRDDRIYAILTARTVLAANLKPNDLIAVNGVVYECIDIQSRDGQPEAMVITKVRLTRSELSYADLQPVGVLTLDVRATVEGRPLPGPVRTAPELFDVKRIRDGGKLSDDRFVIRTNRPNFSWLKVEDSFGLGLIPLTVQSIQQRESKNGSKFLEFVCTRILTLETIPELLQNGTIKFATSSDDEKNETRAVRFDEETGITISALSSTTLTVTGPAYAFQGLEFGDLFSIEDRIFQITLKQVEDSVWCKMDAQMIVSAVDPRSIPRMKINPEDALTYGLPDFLTQDPVPMFSGETNSIQVTATKTGLTTKEMGDFISQMTNPQNMKTGTFIVDKRNTPKPREDATITHAQIKRRKIDLEDEE